MANDLTTRVWYLDTASGTPLWLSQVWIKFVEWYNPANADTFELQNQNGKPILRGISEAAGDTQTFNVENQYEGLLLKALSTTNQGATPPGSILLVHIK
jgi:hypothetical protein